MCATTSGAAAGLGDERLGVRAGEHDRQRARQRERRRQRRDRLVAARVVVGVRDQAQLAAGRRVVHPDAEQVRGEPVRQLDRPLGERRLRVALQPDRALRAQRRVALERHHHVGGRDALARQQVADEPRARQLARDVVLQVRVQAAVARVELRRRADREHGGVEQVEPERRGHVREPVVGVGDRLAARQLERAVVGDVEAAERVGRVRVRRRDALDRRHHAAVDEVEADADRSAIRRCWSATESASRSIASPGCDTLSGPLALAPRCWTTCASSWAISLSPLGRARVVLAAGEVDVGAGRERARGHGAVELVRGVVGVHADVGEVAERARHAVGDARVERRAAAAGRVDRRLHVGVDGAVRPDAGALLGLARERAAAERGGERLVADVGGELRHRRALLALGLGLRVGRLDALALELLRLLLPVHAGASIPRPRRAAQGALGQPVGPL